MIPFYKINKSKDFLYVCVCIYLFCLMIFYEVTKNVGEYTLVMNVGFWSVSKDNLDRDREG